MGAMRIGSGLSRIVVPTVIEGEGEDTLAIGLLLDTGATMTALRRDDLVKLGYEPDRSTEKRLVATGSDVSELSVVTVKSITVLGQKVSRLDVLCLDLPAKLMFSGLLGMNFLNRFDTSILFSEGLLRIDEIK